MRNLLLIFALLASPVYGQTTSADKGSSGRSFGSGSKPTPHIHPPAPHFGSGSKPHATDKTFGSGKQHTEPSKPNIGSKPHTDFDHHAGQSQHKLESKKNFEKGKTPASTYTDSKGKIHDIDPRDRRIHTLREQLTEEKLRNRNLRERQFYNNYYSRPIVVYHDPYSSLFWYWLLDRTIEQQALWAYHHRLDMDAARYNDLLSKNAELAGRIRALESQNTPRNSTYTPPGMADHDLMYTDEYVSAAYNPQHIEEDSNVLMILLYVFLILAIVALLIWLIFVKKW